MKLDLSELETFSVGYNEILLPSHFDKEMKDGIAATIMSKFFQIKSIDYTLKKYVVSNDKEIVDEIHDDKIIIEIKDCLKKIKEKHSLINYTEDKVATLGVHASLTRLNTSYEVCIFLINLGYYFEANTIIRLIFEQFVFCTNLCDISNDEYEEIRNSTKNKTLDTTNIKKLKDLVQDLRIGVLYKALSEKAHIDITEVSNYIQYNEDDDEVVIIQRSRELTSESAYLLLIMCYIHEIVLEYSFKDFLPHLNFIKRFGSQYKSVPSTEYQNKIKKFEKG